MRVLATAEVVAIPYYTALRDATGSPLLRSICCRILSEEAQHLRFQAFTFGRLGQRRSAFARRIACSAHRWFLMATTLLVWIEHRPVFRAGGYSLRQALEAKPYRRRGVAAGLVCSRQMPSAFCAGRSEKLNNTESSLAWWETEHQEGTMKMSRADHSNRRSADKAGSAAFGDAIDGGVGGAMTSPRESGRQKLQERTERST